MAISWPGWMLSSKRLRFSKTSSRAYASFIVTVQVWPVFVGGILWKLCSRIVELLDIVSGERERGGVEEALERL